MKAKAYLIGILAALPGLCFADLVDFGAKTTDAPDLGFIVTSVEEDSPAAEIGLTKGDLITKVDGRQVQATTSLARLIAGLYPVGSEIEITWTREGEEKSAKTTLDKELTERAFDQSYPQNASGTGMVVLGSNNLDIDIEKEIQRALELSKGLNLTDDEEDMQQLGSTFKFALGSGAGSVHVSSTTLTPEGDTISVSSTGGEERDVTITDKDGEVVFEDTITEEDIDKVPERFREQVKGMISGGGMNVRLLGGSGILRSGPSENQPEKDVDDLLEEIEAEEEQAKEESEDVDDLLEELENGE